MEKANLELFEMLFNKFVEGAQTSIKHYYYDADKIGYEINQIINIFDHMKALIEQAKKVEG